MVRPAGRFRGLGVEVARDGQYTQARPCALAEQPLDAARGARRARRGRGRGKPRGLVGRLLAGGGLPRLPVLDQRGRDVLGLALVALGVFMGFVLYGGWDGGRAGHGLAVALGWVLGKARVLAPLALVGAGGMLLLAQALPARRSLLGDPRTIGAVCLFAAATLALAAGTLGVSSGAPHGDAAWTSAYLQAHGGVVGEGVYQLAHKLVQDVGVDILVVFLLFVGATLITGASLGGALRATGSGVAETTRMMRARGAAPRRSPTTRRWPSGDAFGAAPARARHGRADRARDARRGPGAGGPARAGASRSSPTSRARRAAATLAAGSRANAGLRDR